MKYSLLLAVLPRNRQTLSPDLTEHTNIYTYEQTRVLLKNLTTVSPKDTPGCMVGGGDTSDFIKQKAKEKVHGRSEGREGRNWIF